MVRTIDGTGAVATFKNPYGVAVDGAGNVYTADCNDQTIRKITPAGVVTTAWARASVSAMGMARRRPPRRAASSARRRISRAASDRLWIRPVWANLPGVAVDEAEPLCGGPVEPRDPENRV